MTIGKQRRLVDLLLILGLLLLATGVGAFAMDRWVVALICLPAAVLVFMVADGRNKW
jgi:hypothetical protein